MPVSVSTVAKSPSQRWDRCFAITAFTFSEEGGSRVVPYSLGRSIPRHEAMSAAFSRLASQ
jgi:hypothetical protein